VAAKTYTDWPDGKKHSIPYAQHLINLRNNAGNPLTLPPPPVGTYDPAIDYNSQAANRGFEQTRNDAQTAFEQGQQDYGLNLGDLTRGRDNSLSDLGTNAQRGLLDIGQAGTRNNEDFWTQTGNLQRQYGILGRQQAEGAAQRGVTSAGLLGKSAQVRAANQGRDQGVLQTAHDRTEQDLNTAYQRTSQDYATNAGRTNTAFDQGKTRLDLGQARQFGGFNGQTLLNPLTGQPEFGSLITGVTRAGAENSAYQAAAGQQRASQAAGMGYISPLTQNNQRGGTVAIGGTPVTDQMWQNGLLLDAMLAGSKAQQPSSGVAINGKPLTQAAWQSGAFLDALRKAGIKV
jgi:hypothetical protein